MTMRTAFFLLLFLVVGCDSGDGGDALPRGQFSGSVSGARVSSLSGRALFSVDDGLGSWGLILAASPTRVVSASVFRDALTVGSFVIPEAVAASMGEFSGGTGVDFAATTGRLSVTEASDDLVRGTLVFEGEAEGGERVSVETAFAASRLVVPTAAGTPAAARVTRRGER